MATYERLDYGSDDGCQIGDASAKVGFYGKVPVVRRTYNSTLHGTAQYASSASFGATQLAIVVEIANTLTGLGIWPTS